ncbi:MAG: hypothetical protein KAJ19_22590, partial [Gammaproteobacteria bacterium]|nr:hypothetical protein [Gammaproteobacteria bacterium]
TEADDLKVLTWERDLIDNMASVDYSYSVPMEWPELYQLGPVEINYGDETFEEARVWWVAVDPMIIDEIPDSAADDDGTNVLTEVSSDDSSYATLNVYKSGGSSSDYEDYIESSWNDNGIPSGSTINSVVYYFKHYESSTTPDLTIRWYDGSVWTEVYDAPETTSEQTHNYNLTSYIDTVAEANNVTLRYRWYYSGGSTWDYDTHLNYEHLEIAYTPPGSGSPPTITNVASSTPTRTTVRITWDTNQSDSNNRVIYSTNSDLSGSTWSSWDNDTDSVDVHLTSLSSETTYYYSAYSYNGTNISLYSNSSINNFTTAGSTHAHGNVKNKDGNPVTTIITVYDEDGTTILYNITGNSFDFEEVPIGGYVLFDALDSINVSAMFKINGSLTNVEIIFDDYGLENPESTASPGNSMKYVGVSAVNVSYESVVIKMHYSDAELGDLNEGNLKIYHHKDGAWNQLATTIDQANNILTAQTASLSTFGGSSVDEYGNRLICWTDKKVYADDPFDADTLNNWGTNTIDLKVNVYAIVLDGEGCILRNITSSNITGTLKDTQLLDHWDGTADTAAVHHIINPGSYSEASFYNITIGGATSYPFNDEGTTPDLVAGDGIFSAVINVAELPSTGSEGGSWSTSGLSEEHLNISINVNYSTISITQNVLFTRLSCAHGSFISGQTRTPDKSTSHGIHGDTSESDQSNCVYCHHGYEHDLGAHTDMISPYSGFEGSSEDGQTYYWNTATSEDFSDSNKGTGYATSSVAYETVAPGSEYCISCHYETGTGTLDLDSSTDRPSCAWDSSPLGVTCHSDTSSEGANLTGIDWRWKENEASGSRTHNHTATTPANVSCDICHQNFHSNQLPNTSSSTDINDQCTICHSSTGPQKADYVHSSDTTNCKACHLDTDQVMDPHLIAEAGIPNPNCSECHDLGGQSLNLIDYDIFNNSDYVHNLTGDGKNPLNWNADIGAATRPEDRMCWACHGEDDNEDGLANFSEQPANDHPNRYKNARTCEEC